MTTATPSVIDQLNEWLGALEGEHFEFKEAKNRFSFDDLEKYCCAMANEGGGRVLLGVTNARPRRVVGTRAFPQLEDLRRTLMEHLRLRTEVIEINHPDGRVLVFEVPSRPFGVPVKSGGVYWARSGDSLSSLSEDRLRLIFAEAGNDFSAEVCRGLSIADLDASAIENFRTRWIEKSKNHALASMSAEQLLRDAEVLVEDGLTCASVILFGTRAAIVRHLAQAEIVFEYRSAETSGPAQQRLEFQRGFFASYDDLWVAINLRNDVQHYQDGLFVLDIPTFDERSVREALLNAVSHRNYQMAGSTFIRQYARRIVIESPGGFPVGITTENVLDRQAPRNRRLAEVFARCGLVERSGQGMNLMFEQSIRQGKLVPDFRGTDAHHVVVTLHGTVQDPRFPQFLEKIGRETLATFDTHDYLVLDLIDRDESVPPALIARLRRLVELGVVERIGRGKGTRYLLSRRFYAMSGRKGAYTRRRGLDDETQKELLLRHLRDNPSGSALSELRQVLPQVGERKVQFLLQELRAEGRADLKGARRWARWFAAKTTTPGSGV